MTMRDEPLLGECWYAIELSGNLGKSPLGHVLGGWEIVLFRDADGQARAIDRRCPHRDADLARGEVVAGCVRCPYHGWTFDGEGRCRDIPAERGATPPRNATVRAWPTEEHYGLIWVYAGTAAPPPPVPPFPEYGQAGWRAISGEYHWDANYARVVENGLDFAHGPFVHAQSFGRKDAPEVAPYEVHSVEGGARAEALVPASRPKGLWGFFLQGERPPVHVTLHFWMPSINRIDLSLPNGWRIIIFDCNVPIDANRTRTLWVSLRDFFPGAWADGNARSRVLEIFDEDRPVVESQPPGPPPGASEQCSHRSDRLPLRYRAMRERWLGEGRVLPGPRTK